MIPIVGLEGEIALMRELVAATVARYAPGLEVPIGTMIELPRACLVADQIAKHADVFYFGTNAPTHTTFGFSRDDVGSFLPDYLNKGLLPRDPFAGLNEDGVGALIRIAVGKGRGVKPKLKIGICGEHGGDPASVALCDKLGLDYVSCSPFRIPIARVAAAQAVLASQATGNPKP